MRGVFACSLFTALGLASAHVSATDFQGYVKSVFPANGKVYVYAAEGNTTGSSACSGNGSAMVYVIDPNTAFGRALFSVVLTAKVTGRLVYLAGDGACSPSAYSSTLPGEGLVAADLKG